MRVIEAGESFDSFISSIARPPSELIKADNAKLFSGFVDELSEFLRTVYDLGSLLFVLAVNDLSNLGILPWSGQVQLSSSLEFLLSLDQGIKDPFSVLKGDV